VEHRALRGATRRGTKFEFGAAQKFAERRALSRLTPAQSTFVLIPVRNQDTASMTEVGRSQGAARFRSPRAEGLSIFGVATAPRFLLPLTHGRGASIRGHRLSSGDRSLQWLQLCDAVRAEHCCVAGAATAK